MQQLLQNYGARRAKLQTDSLPTLNTHSLSNNNNNHNNNNNNNNSKSVNNQLSPAEQLAAIQAQLLSLDPRKPSPSLSVSQSLPPTVSSLHNNTFSSPLASPSLITTSATSTASTLNRPLMVDNYTNTLNSGKFPSLTFFTHK